MQINIPYLFSSLGYAILFDNTYPGYFDLGKTDKNEWFYKAKGGAFTFYVTIGSSEKELMRKYYDLTGYPKMLPKWAYGLLQSKCAYENEQQAYNTVQKFKSKNLPLDAIILDAYWFGGFKPGYPHNMGNFSWYSKNFPDPEGYIKRLKADGVRTIVINEPYINVESDNFSLLKEKGWLVKQKGSKTPFVFSPFWCGDVALFDITNPKAQAWQWSKFKNLIKQGVDGLWVDLVEPEAPVKNGIFYLGSEEKIHNIYALLYAKLIYDGYRKDFPEKRVFNLTRSGFAGIQRFGTVNWSGDASKSWDALKLQVPMMLGAATSGIPYFSSDIGGFTKVQDTVIQNSYLNQLDGGKMLTTPELYTRWFQQGVFAPILRPHSGEDQACEPFAFDLKTEKITASYLKLRYKLLPYIYSYAHKTATTGEPLVSPLFYQYNDPRSRRAEYQYMFGREMLVAPVLEQNAVSASVYLPDDNRWANYWDDKIYMGGKNVVVDAPIETIPLFIKIPSIIPLANAKKYSTQYPDKELTMLVYPGDKASFDLYEDDGESYGYDEGEFSITNLQTDMVGRLLMVKIYPARGSYRDMVTERLWNIEIHLTASFDIIKVNGRPLERHEYSYDVTTGIINIPVKVDSSRLILIEVDNFSIKKS
jgi:oligosaccharide 4-alpha-D-glucosyltransferase